MLDNAMMSLYSRSRKFIPAAALALLLAIPIARADDPTTAPAASVDHWQDLKLGLFIHFGPWAQTEIGSIWQLIQNPDPHKRARFSNLASTFNPTEFDADQWAKLAHEAGMRYVVFTTKHHDGFCNFDTAQTDYRITGPICPYHTNPNPDITGQIVKSFRAAGLDVGLYYSNLDWHQMPDGLLKDGTPDPDYKTKHPDHWARYVQYETDQVRELLTNYGPIDEFWFDIPWAQDPQRDFVPMLKAMRQIEPDLIINDRGTAEFADYTTFEQTVPPMTVPSPWESNITITQDTGFWYKGPHALYKSSTDLIRLLADVVSKGGNLLLNVGPLPDGSWTAQETVRLANLGHWLQINGEAIFKTRPGTLADRVEWGRFTYRGKRMYVIVFNWPKEGQSLTITAPVKPKSATLMNGRPVPIKISDDGASFELCPTGPAPDPAASVIAVDLE